MIAILLKTKVSIILSQAYFASLSQQLSAQYSRVAFPNTDHMQDYPFLLFLYHSYSSCLPIGFLRRRTLRISKICPKMFENSLIRQLTLWNICKKTFSDRFPSAAAGTDLNNTWGKTKEPVSFSLQLRAHEVVRDSSKVKFQFPTSKLRLQAGFLV